MGVQPSIRQIGKYAVLDVIGTGGMGIVYKAHDPAIGRTVAIKMLRQSDAASGLFDRFFSREMRSTGSLNHKNIVTVFDSGEQDGNPYLVMEFLEGEPASKIISERRSMPLVEKLDLVIQVCDGLQYAHDRNIIHRDIKPANVIVLADGTAKIVDFGVARIAGGESSIVQTGQLVGSLSYMSPEQINSIPIDARSDVFSTGVMLYELLTYELPFKGNDAATTFVKILREEPVALTHYGPDFPPGLQTVLSRALAKNVNDRYQTAEEFGFELLSVQKELKSASIADCMKRAEAAMHRGDLERVRLHLQEVIRLDRQNERANRLLREVRKAIQQQQRQSQIIQMRSQAQVALAGAQYEEALACADQALRLDPTDAESIKLCDEIRATISRVKAVREALNRAETALYAGDFDEAKEAVEESLRLDPGDAEARAMASVINKELAERSRRAQVQVFVDQARKGIAERKFNEAIDALHQAEELDPSDSNVRELMQWALRGQEQEKKRRFLQEITEQIEKALHAGDFSSACTISDMGLQRFPEESTLLRLRAISEKQREIAERRRFVNEQSLAVKALNDQGKLEDAIQVLTAALKKIPGEPNLESLLANTRADLERQKFEREEAERQEAIQRAETEARARMNQEVLNRSAELKQLLDARADLAETTRSVQELRTAMEAKHVEENARQVAEQVLSELETRVRSRDQALQELDHVRRVIERPHDTSALSEASDRLRSIKATFPNERNISGIFAELSEALTRLREKRDQSIEILTTLAQELDATPTSEATEVFRRAREIATGFVGDARVGALLQQIESSVKRRLDRHAELMRDLTMLSEDLEHVHSLDELARAVERGKSIAAMDATDRELAELAAQLESDAARVRGLMESLLGEMQGLAEAVAAAANVHEAEALVPQVKAVADKRTGFQELQEAAKRVHAEVQGWRIEHDLVIQELESVRSSVPILETNEELESAAARASQCRQEHSQDRTIITVCAEIEHEVERILRERAELLARIAECDNAMRTADERLHAGDLDAAMNILESVALKNSDRPDLQLQIKIVRVAMDERRAEQERLEREHIARQKAEAEERARQQAAAKAIEDAQQLLALGQEEASLACLRKALESDPERLELKSILESLQADVAQRRAEREQRERERLERERIAREKAEAEERARKEAADRVIQEAGDLLNQGQEAESIACLSAALEHDRENPDLRLMLEMTQAEVSRRRAERERLERERLERERIAREKAEAEARARSEAAERAIQQTRTLLAQGQEDASLASLHKALERDPDREDLHSTLVWVQQEVAQRRAERERLERERIERERVAREKAEAERRAKKDAADRAVAEARWLLGEGQEEQSLRCLRAALEADPTSADLQAMLKSVQAEVNRLQAQRERIAKEKAQAEARARKEAADRAIAEARQLFANGQEEESLQRLRAALERDPASTDLQSTLKSVQAEISRLRAERERLERERAERERQAKEKAEAEARSRKAAAEQAVRRAGSLLAQGKDVEALEILRSAMARDPESQDLKAAWESTQAEAARLQAERERLERERLEKERIAREKAEAEAQARKQAADLVIREARDLQAQGRGEDSVQRLRAALEQDPRNADLRSALDSIQAELARQRAEQERLERERLERERIAREKAEAEVRARKQAADQAIKESRGLLAKTRGEEAIERLRSALQGDPENQELRLALESTQAEVARRRAEQERLERERLERERIAREKAEAEAQARREAAGLAIKEGRELLAQGRRDESLQRLRSTLQQDPQNPDLRKELDSTQAEIARQRAEQERLERERLERERLERERIVREKAEAEARARREAAEQALKQAQTLQAQGRNGDAEQLLASALERDPANSQLKTTLQTIRAEIARQRAEKERQEREQKERERIAKEKAEAEERARAAAAEQAVQKARKLLAKGSGTEALEILGTALKRDPQNKDLQSALQSTQAEIERKRAEREQLERERVEKEQAALRTRKAEIEDALKQARKLQADGKLEEALQTLRKVLKRYPDSQELRTALDSVQAEIARQRGEKQRVAELEAKAKKADQLKAAAEVKPAPRKPQAGEEVRPDARRRMVLIGIAAGAVLALAATGYMVSRTVFAPKLEIGFRLEPADGTLRVDGNPTECHGSCTLRLSVKDHTVTLEKPGYTPVTISAGPHSDKTFTLRLAPVTPAASSSISIVTDAIMTSPVTLDGNKVGDLSGQRLELSGLTAGVHHVLVSGDKGALDLSVQVSAQGAVQVDGVTGQEQNPVVAMIQNGERQEIFCRCDGAEIRIDGKKPKAAGQDRYTVPGKGSEHEVTLVRKGQMEKIPLLGTDAKYGMIFIATEQGASKPQPVAPDAQAWQAIKDSHELATLMKFRQQFPQSPYARIAYQKCAELSWDKTRNSTQLSDFRAFVSSYPDSPHVAEANTTIASYERKALDDMKRRADADAKQKADADARQKADTEAKQRADAELKARADQEAKQRADQQAQQKAAEDEATRRADLQQQRQLILNALDTYSSALDKRDRKALAAIWPTVPPSFGQLISASDKIHVSLDKGEPQINGDSATVPCTQTIQYSASGKSKSFQQSRLFRLRKVQGRWIIETDN